MARAVNLSLRDTGGKLLREKTLPTGQFDGIIPLADGGVGRQPAGKECLPGLSDR